MFTLCNGLLTTSQTIVMYIVVNGISSKPLRVISGVSQGSVLWSLLFFMKKEGTINGIAEHQWNC